MTPGQLITHGPSKHVPDERVAQFTCSFGAHDRANYQVVGTSGLLTLDNAYARFVPLADDRGEGLSEVALTGRDGFDAGGVRFTSHAGV